MHAIAHPLPSASHHAARPDARRAPRLATWALAGALALSALAWHTRAVPLAATTPQRAALPGTHAQPAGPAIAPALLATLRQAAALGNVEASITLVSALLDRYDAGAGAGALMEALQWMERDLDTVPMLGSPQVQRVVLGACARDPLLQWHWLCNQGE